MTRSAAALFLCLAVTACGPGRDVPIDTEVLVRVGTVALDHQNTPVVILEERDGPRLLPIWIGSAEASSIAAEINRQPAPRPNFHDMAQRLIQQLEATLERVVVTELRDRTYYAILYLRSHGRGIEIDARPSDAIAVALRLQAPILVRASVFDEAGGTLSDDSERTIRGPALGPDGSQAATHELSL